jgi:hypothetical protein
VTLHSQLYFFLGNVARAESGFDLNRLLHQIDTRRDRPKKFLSLNYMPRWWRYALALKLLADGQLVDGLVSFHGKSVPTNMLEGGWHDNVALRAELIGEGVDPAYCDHLERLDAMSPLLVDTPAQIDRTSFAYDSPDAGLYASTRFSIVTESDLNGHGGSRFTEKALKPLAYGHPFLTLGHSGLIRQLKALGFRTSSAIVDEGYDDIENNIERVRFIFREIDRLLSMSRDQLRDACFSMRDDLIHNAVHSRIGVARAAASHPGVAELLALTAPGGG